MIENYRGSKPPKVGLILYEHYALGAVLRRRRWPLLTFQKPAEAMEAFRNPLLNQLFAEKYGIATPANFAVSRPRALGRNLAVGNLAFSLGQDLESLKDVEGLVSFLKKWYPGKTPACLAYKAGYANSESLVRTTLEGLPADAARAKEKFLGLIYVGPCLTGGPENG